MTGKLAGHPASLNNVNKLLIASFGVKKGNRVLSSFADECVRERDIDLINSSGSKMEHVGKKIYIVDDDDAISRTIHAMLRNDGWYLETFSSGAAFLAAAADLPVGCVLLDLKLSDMTGLDVQIELHRRGVQHAMVLMTGYGDVPDAVAAMRGGALDFIQKPFTKTQLLASIARTEAAVASIVIDVERARRLSTVEKLTKREQDVLHGLSHDLQNKVVAYQLGISVRTIEMHRANILRKFGVRTIAAVMMLAQEGKMISES